MHNISTKYFLFNCCKLLGVYSSSTFRKPSLFKHRCKAAQICFQCEHDK